MKSIEIGSYTIGPEKPCFLVAEIGINHNGHLDLAKQTIDAAVQAGADGVKFQNYRTEDFISDRSLTYQYMSQDAPVTESQFDLFKRCELDRAALKELKAYCDDKGVIFHSTPTSREGIKDLMEIGVQVIKNGSDFLTHLPLIRSMGNTKLPVVLSTGMATVSEIYEAVRAFRETGNDRLVLLHCVSAYPAPPEDVNLRKIPVLASAFDCLVGFSDHTVGTIAATGAVVMGANWIEKHFTLDKSLPGPDHWFSADPAEFKQLVTSVRTMERSLGHSKLGLASSESKNRESFRLSCVAAEDLREGHVLCDADVLFRRPGTGLAPAWLPMLSGRRINRNIEKGEIIKMEDL
ncbi:N-acetylneuraminate synthase family protein [Desulfatitalea tepidiphila]|uniref:N-acetylneuraminate synthase family protein n=1 Tax=Desulfatitalea tepidiphila TaxID=1185843 RepID=UPI000978547B|nr:N-acetylneuraminate synthase family protein [Desulfatitalea tepidiphila]